MGLGLLLIPSLGGYIIDEMIEMIRTPKYFVISTL